ncbi:MAG: ribosome maturation factor RimP [Alphaproteobacteria bacterium]|nr:ribosome maturation factor RimP [Alphaproteobacteria bacterium]
MDVIDKITALVAPSLDAMGYAIVQLKLADSARRKTLTLMAERNDGRIMGFDDCTAISRTVSALMDVEDPITSAYDLEVCSPGIDRPLVKFADYARYAGYEVKLETLIPVEGRKRFRGIITGAKDNVVSLKTDNGDFSIPFTNIKSAKLVMTDELVKSFLKQQKKEQG